MSYRADGYRDRCREAERESANECSLRRWPQEAAASIVSGAPEYQAVDGTYPVGAALPIAKARLRVADVDETKPVKPCDETVTYTVTLKASRTQLQTKFCDAAGKEICGVYYVYVQRKQPPVEGQWRLKGAGLWPGNRQDLTWLTHFRAAG